MATDPAPPPAPALPFADRAAAGRLLGVALRDRLRARGEADGQPVVLGIPRGGIVVAAAVADVLGAPLDAIVARKIPAPDQAELAVGAATADGSILLEPWAASAGADERYLATAARRTVEAARDREARLRAGMPPLALAGRLAVVVDDGIATGATMAAALLAVRARGAARVIAAAPVGASGSVAEIARGADETVVLATPDPFLAVGEWYRRFEQTEDAEVLALLAAQRNRPATHA